MKDQARAALIARKDYRGVCWWCGRPADSREHRFKKSDLVAQFGAGSYISSGGVVRGIAGRLQEVQGPNSRAMKFAAFLCQACNNARSQPFDRAYERFIQHVVESEAVILRANAIDLGAVYGPSWRAGHSDFARYVAKHVACRLAEAGVEVSGEVLAFLDGASRLPGFQMSFEIREDILAMGPEDRGLWLGGLEYLGDGETGIRWVGSHYGFGWLRIVWEHAPGLPAWRSKNRRLTLSRGWNLHPTTIAARDSG